jgi:glucose-6-phosphate 1-dehydrogenase
MTQSLTFVLFGATGDLSRKKIIPALHELFIRGELPPVWNAICFIRKSWQQAELEDFIADLIPSGSNLKDFTSHFMPFEGDLNDLASFTALQSAVEKLGSDKRIFYLSVSPSLYTPIIENLKQAKLTDDASSVMIEKPFGRCMRDARELTELLESFLKDGQILRVDHYLGKDAMRDAAELKRGEVIEITARFIEDKTIGERGAFYDSIGAFLDVGQNHLLMMLATTLRAVSGASTRLDALRTLAVSGETCVRGQYEGYQSEKDVKPASQTETYFKVGFQNADTAITILGGKGFYGKAVDIKIVYKDGNTECIDFSAEREGSLEPHAKVIGAALRGERDMFVSRDEAFEEWRIAEDALKALRATELKVYPKGANYKEISNI